MAIGVNKAESNAQRIKAGDYGSLITLQLDNVESVPVSDVQWVRAYITGNSTQYVDIPDFSVTDSAVAITMPPMDQGEYNLEVKDEVGRIYPAEGTLRLSVLPSTKHGAEVYYLSYKDEILEDVTPIIEGYLNDNPDDFRGQQGDKGDTVAVPPKSYTRDEYDGLDSYEEDTLYIVKEV